MKRIIALFILSFMLLGLFVGCAPQGNTDGEGENAENGGTVSGGSTNGGNNAENGGSDDHENETGNPPEGEIPSTNPETPEGERPSTNPETPETDPETPEDPEQNPEVGTAVGNLFADLTLNTVDGGSVNTADYRGKIIILNIWATWCPPCQAELPDFNRIASDYEDEAVIIAAHTPSGNSTAKSYVDTNFPDTKIIFAYDSYYSDAFLAAGGVNSIPQTAILDQNGVIIYVHTGMMSYAELASIIEAHS